MAVARAQIRGVSKRMFSGISIPHAPPHLKITDDNDKFPFLDPVEGKPWSVNSANLWHFYINRSYLRGATQEEKMDFYVKTAAQVIGSEEEAKDRMRMITRDCSLDGFGLEICMTGAYKIAGTVSFNDGELIHWSLIPKRREKGRFPLPKPDLGIIDSDDWFRKKENEMEYD